MCFDAAGGFVALEVRDADLLLARFYSLDTENFGLLELPLPAAKNWWLGLEDVHAGLLLLHGYGDRKLGQHKGVFAYSAGNGTLQWQHPEPAFYGIGNAGIVALDLQTQEVHLLQTVSGEKVITDLALEKAGEAIAAYSLERQRYRFVPMLYLEGEDYFGQVQQFLWQQLQVTAARGIEYAETGNSIVVSYYTEPEPGNLANYLAVFNLDGEMLLHELLASGLSGIGSDSFIIFMQKLYFIRQRQSLAVYSLLT